LHVHESVEVSTITKNCSQTANLKYCTEFCKQWRNKEDKWGLTVLSAGLGGPSTHFAGI